MRRSTIVLALLLSACGGDRDIAPDTVALIAGEPVSLESFDEYLDRNTEGAEVLEPVVVAELFDQFLDDQLLARLAEERGLVEDDLGHTEVLRFLLQGIEETVDEAAVDAYYEENRGAFARPEQVHLRQILVASHATAREALDALTAGEAFTEVATRLSEAPGAEVGGDQGFLAVSALPPSFAAKIRSLEPGEHSQIVPAEYGHHIFQVVSRRPAETPPLDVVAPEIRAMLVREAVDARTTELLDEARRRYRVEIFTDNLPFAYRGSYADSETPD